MLLIGLYSDLGTLFYTLDSKCQSLQFMNHCSGPESELSDAMEVTLMASIIFWAVLVMSHFYLLCISKKKNPYFFQTRKQAWKGKVHLVRGHTVKERQRGISPSTFFSFATLPPG